MYVCTRLLRTTSIFAQICKNICDSPCQPEPQSLTMIREAMDPMQKKRPRCQEKHVFVEMPTGDLLHWKVAEPFTNYNVKEHIFLEEGISVEQQRLLLDVPDDDRTISDPVKITNEIHFILMPMYYNFQAKEKAVQIKGHTSDEEGEGEEEEDENEEEKEEEDAKEEEESSKRLKIGVLEEG